MLAALVVLGLLLGGTVAGAALVIAWALYTRTPWRELGFVAPPNWYVEVVVASVGGVLLKLAMKALVMPALGFPPENATYHYLAGNSAALPGMLFTVVVIAGGGEELVWRAFAFQRLRSLAGNSRPVLLGGLVATSLLFGLAHYQDQGVAGAVQATVVGAVYGTIFLRTKRIWPAMIVHAAFDVAAVFMIYWRLEVPIARLLFH